MMLSLKNLSYIHPNKDLLFDNISLNMQAGHKMALIGNNGTGKSTLLKIIAKDLQPSAGSMQVTSIPYYVPQLFGQYNVLSIAEALRIDKKLKAFHDILNGNLSAENYDILQDDWTIEERICNALNSWQLEDLDLSQCMESLSGGQKTKVFLAGIAIHQPDLILLDEPSNHMDTSGRALLYDYVQTTKQTLLIVSHDRKLLNLLDTTCELGKNGLTVYGGNYDFYVEQKEIATLALNQDIHSTEKALKKAKEKEREIIERQQKLDSRAKKNLSKAGLPKIVANTWRNSAENSTSKIKDVHAERTDNIRQKLQDLRSPLAGTDQMKLDFDNTKLHRGKKLFQANDINFHYQNQQYLWKENLLFQITGGERIAILGANGSGKTSLIKVILGQLIPQIGTVSIADNRSIYIDQDYAMINTDLKIYEQAQQFNMSALQEHEIKTRLNRFLFTREDWDKSCHVLSGGERMRLMLCCLSIGNQSPDIIVLDEPTNNLDVQNIEILTNSLKDYGGTLLVISHDDTFLNEIGIERTIDL